MQRILHLLFLLPLLVQAHEHESDERFYRFVPNKGQFEQEVVYKGKVNSGSMFLTNDGWIFHFQDNSMLTKSHLGGTVEEKDQYIKGQAYKVGFLNSSTQSFVNEEKTTEYYNYYLGNDKSKWASGIFAYRIVQYKKLYPGIDLKLYSKDENLKYDFIVAAGADPGLIKQQYTGVDELSINSTGDFVVRTNVNTVTEKAPKAWQIINGVKKEVKCVFVLTNNVLSYKFPNGYDTGKELIIDPVLIFGSYTGSTADNFGMTATYSSQGHLFTGGTAFNIGFPTTFGAYMTTANANGSTYGVTDVVVTKFAPNGASLVYSTYIGGGTGSGGTETVHSLICNANDELFLFGVTSSTDFPTTAGAYDQTFNGGSFIGFVYNGAYFDNGTDIYVSKFDVNGTTLLASTYVGGSGNDGVNYNQNFISGGNWNSNYDSLQTNYGDQFRGEIMVDDLGNCYIASTTKSSDFPTANAFQSTIGGSSDAVAFKLDANLSNLTWSTYIGGSNKDAAYSIKVDDSYNAFVTGGTCSNNFPTTPGTYHTTYQGGKTDGFLIKISPNGSSLVSSTFLGTNSYDQSFFVELDRFDGVYVLGQTSNPSAMPPTNVNYSNANSGQFIQQFTSDLSTLRYSTLFGNGSGNFNISPSAFLVDICGNIYVSGWGANILQSTPLNNMPVTANAIQPTNGDGFNFYLTVFSRNINSLLYATYFGGPLSHEHVDGGTSRFDANGVVYQSVCAGCGSNDDFPTTPGAWSNVNLSTNCNNGVFKFDFEIEPIADFSTDVLSGCAPLTIQFQNTSPIYSSYFWDFGNNDTTSTDPTPTRTFTTPGTYIVYLIVEDSICLLQDTAQKIITVYPPLQLYAADSIICTPPATLDLVANSFGTVTDFYWSSSPTFSDTLNSPITDSTVQVTVSGDTVFFINVHNAFCSYTDTIFVHFPNLNINLTGITGLCTGDSAIITVTNTTPWDTLTYDWGPDSLIISGDGTSSVVVSPDYPNWITVTGTMAQGCTVSDSTFVTVNGPPTGLVTATADDYTLLTGQSTILHALPNGYTYVWTPSSTLDNANLQNPTATPTVTTTYTVTVSNGGCSVSDTVQLRIFEFICDDPYIYIPNAFTPNGDGDNDVLYVRGNGITELIFRVYDRWGEKVFETTNQSIGWDGTFNGRESDPAVFVWYVEATCEGGEKYFNKGNTTLIR